MAAGIGVSEPARSGEMPSSPSGWRARLPAVVGDAGVYVAANVVNAALPFLLIPILTRALGPGPYGTVAMFGVAVNVLAAFTGLNANSAIAVRYFQLSADRVREYLGACVVILGVSAIVLLALVLPFRDALASRLQIPPLWLVVAIGVAAANFLTSVRLVLWQVGRSPWPYAALAIGQNAAHLCTAGALVVWGHYGWAGATIGQALSAFVAGGVAVFLLQRQYRMRVWGTRADIRDALAYGVPLVPHIVGGLLIAGGDRYLVSSNLGVEAAGLYMMALQMGMALGVLTGAFNRAYMPWLLARLATPDPIRDVAIVRGTYAYGVLLAVAAAAVTACAPWVIPWIAGPAFVEAIGVVKWIAAAYACGGMYYMVTNYVFYAGRTGTLSWITLGSGVSGLATTSALLPTHGIEGAGIGYLVSNLLMFLGTWILAQRVRPMPWVTAIWPAKRAPMGEA